MQRLFAILCAVGDEAYRLIPLLSYRLLDGLWVGVVCGNGSALAQGYSWELHTDSAASCSECCQACQKLV